MIVAGGAMSVGWPFVGRQEELALIAQAMHDRGVGGLVVAGPVGVGKTRLAAEALGAAEPDRFEPLRATATEASKPIPFGALAALLPAELPAATSRGNLLGLAAETLLAGAGGRRPVLVVDDFHLADDLSAALVNQLVRSATAFVLVVVRSGEPAPEPVIALWRNRIVERVDLQQLLRPDVDQLLVKHLGGPVDGLTVGRLWQASAGNALLLRELVTAGADAGALRLVEGVWHWHGPLVLAPRLVELVEQRLGRLTPPEREVLELLAYAGAIGVDLLCLLVSAESLEAVEAKGLCWAEQSGRRMMVHIAHPLYGEVLRAQVPVLRARRRQRQLAEAVEQVGARRADDCLRVATWRLASGTIAAPQVLVAAANRAWRLLDLPLAEHCARAAFDAGGQREAGEILWRVLLLQNRNDEAEQLLATLDDPTAGDQPRAQLVVARAYSLFWGLDRVDAGLALVDQAVAGMGDPPARAEVQSLQAAMLVNAGRHKQAADVADRLLEQPTLRGPVLAMAHYSKALTQLFSGQTAAAITSLNRAVAVPDWATETPWAPILAALWRGQAQLLEGRLDDAAATAESAYQAALRTEWDAAIANACLGRGQVCRARGQLRQSLHWLREGLALAREDHSSGYLFAFILLGELAHTTALLGDYTTARAALAEADATKRASSRIYHVWLDLARPWVVAVGGEMAAAVGQALETATTAASTGATLYHATALHDAARLGGVGTVADALHLLARTSSNALVHSYAAHATALRAHDGAALDHVSAEFETIGMVLHAAEAAAEASRAHQQAGRADSARRAAAHAAVLAARCDGAVTLPLAALRAPSLTPREWEIVKLAAAGLTNEQIANRLVVSIRTVHNHLHQAYTKLGVHRRAELGAVVQLPNPHT